MTASEPAIPDARARLAALPAEALSVCAVCDAAHARAPLAPGETARCRRCDAVIETRKPGAVDRMLLASAAMAALTVMAAVSPFLTLREAGLSRTVSLIDAAAALDAGPIPIGALLLTAVIGLPFLRALAHLYALAPWRLGLPTPRGAAGAMRWSTAARPWAMAEIFMIGVAVSAVKVAGLATLDPGPALFALGGAVLVIGYENAAICRETVWSVIDRGRLPEGSARG
jgi:paraquat-inducible protein A